MPDGALPEPEAPSPADSIAGSLASRMAATPAAPGDALDWAAEAADLAREAAAREGAAAAALHHAAARILDERLGDPAAAAEQWRRAAAADPGHLPARRAQRTLALEQGDDATAAEALAVEVAAATNPTDRQALLLMRGRLLLSLGRVADARALLAEATALDPLRFAAAEEVAAGAAASGDRAALADAYARCAATAADPVLSAHYLAAASALLEEALGRLDRAGALALEAFHLFPSDPILRAGARRHAERLGQAGALAGILRAEAEARSGPGSADAWHALALVEERLGRPADAAAALERGAAEAPDDLRLKADLARVLEKDGRWQEASAALVDLAAGHAGLDEPHHRAEAIGALFRRAEIEEVELGRLDQAIEACQAVLALDPAHRPALSTLGRLCARANDAEGLARAFEGEADAARDHRERAQRLFRAGEVYEDRLGRPEDALARYRDALAADPALGVARAALERLLERLGRFDELLEAVEAELASASPGGEQGQAAWELSRLQRRAELVEAHADDPARSRAAWEAVLARLPGHIPAVRALGRLHARAGRWDELAATFRAEADRADGKAGAELLLRVAELLERRLDRPGDAIQAYRDALGKDPDLAPAEKALERLLRDRGEHDALVALLRARAERADPPGRAAILCEVARLHEEKTWDRPRAVAAYEEALRALPGHTPATRALDRLYAEIGRTEELEQLRRAGPTEESPAERGERLLRLARLRADRAGDLRGALAIAGELEAALPGDPSALLLELRLSVEPARRARARAGLARAAASAEVAAALLAAAVPDLPAGPGRREALDRAGRNAPSSPLLAPHAERALRHAGDHAARALFSERLAASAPDAASRADHWLRAGEARDAAGDGERALADLKAALEAAPGHVPALRAARAHFARSGDWAAVRSSVQAEAVALRDPELAVRAWLEAGAVAEQRFSDTAAAAADYRGALARRPGDPAATARLEAALGGLTAGAVVDAHAAKAREAAGPGEKVDEWLAAARAAASAPAGRDRAFEALGELLALAPAHAEGLELRARLLADAGRAEDALLDAERAAEAQQDPARREALHLYAAVLAGRAGLGNERALPHLRAAVSLAPDDAEALERAVRALLEAGELEEAATLLRRLAEAPTGDRALQADRLARLGELEERLGRTDAGLEAVRRALALDPSHARAFRRLARAESERGDPAAVAERLAETARSAPDPAVAAEAHLEAARIQAGPLQARPRAVEHLRAALAADPARDDVRALLAEQLEDLSPGAAVEEHRALLARDPFRIESWAALFRLFERQRLHDRAYVSATVLRWLGAPAPGPTAERLLLEGDRQVLGPPPRLSDDDWDMLRDEREPDTLAAFFAAAGEVLAEVLAPTAEERGPPVRADHPFRRVLGELCLALGAPDREVYPTSRGRVLVEPGAPHAVLVGVDLARRTTVREQRFLLGRAAARLRGRTGLLEAVPATALWDAVSAAVGQIVPGWRGAAEPPPEVAQRTARALTRKARKALEEPARALADARGAHDLAAFRVAAATTADRAGLVLCGDVPTALALLVREPGAHPSAAEVVAEARRREETRALLAFAAEEKHFLLRQRARVAVA